MGPQSLISSSIHESKGELIERNERDWWVGRPSAIDDLFSSRLFSWGGYGLAGQPRAPPKRADGGRKRTMKSMKEEGKTSSAVKWNGMKWIYWWSQLCWWINKWMPMEWNEQAGPQAAQAARQAQQTTPINCCLCFAAQLMELFDWLVFLLLSFFFIGAASSLLSLIKEKKAIPFNSSFQSNENWLNERKNCGINGGDELVGCPLCLIWWGL